MPISIRQGRLFSYQYLLLLVINPLFALAQGQGLTITDRQPGLNANAAPINAAVSVIFSRPIDPTTASQLRLYSSQAGGKKAGAYVTTDSLVRFTSATGFTPGETVMVSVPATLRSTAGIPASPQVYQFTAAAGGTGSGNFQLSAALTTSGTTAGIAVGDVDGDGDLDFLVANRAGNSVLVRLNGGDATGSNTGLFSGTQSVPVQGSPTALALADVDGDGDLDFLVTNSTSSTVSIRLNGFNASGSNTGLFGGGQNVAVGTAPGALAVGDVDGDGDLDLLAASRSTGTVSVRLNGGNSTGSNTGIFSGSQNQLVAAEISGLTLSDVDGDGDLDLLATGANGNTVQVYLNGGLLPSSNTLSFAYRQQVEVGLYPTSIATGDVDNDGDLDLLTASASTGAVSVRLNGGDNSGSNTGFFYGSQEVAMGTNLSGLALADVDADADLDVVALDGGTSGNNTAGQYVQVRLNGGNASGSGTGVFSRGSTTRVGLAPAALALGDLDQDGDLDLLTSNTGSGSVSVCLNQPPAPVIASFSPVSAVAGTTVTLTGDYLTSASLTVGGLSVPVITNTGTSLTFIVPAGAGTGPVVVTNRYGSTSSPAFSILLRISTTTPARNALNVPAGRTSVQASFTEPLATTVTSSSSLRVFSSIFGGQKSGASGVQGSTLTFVPTAGFKAGEVVSVTVPTTVQSAGGLGASKQVLQFTTAAGGTGRANFQAGSNPVVGYQPPSQVALADVDADGDLDMITANYGTNSYPINVLRNNGAGTFGVATTHDVGGNNPGVKGVTAADVDGDGDLDLLTANADAGNVSVLRNDGTGNFSLQTIWPVGGSPHRLALADLDADGDLDLLVANFGPSNLGNTVSVRLNNGQGSFLGTTELALGNGISGVTAADVDGDGDLDLLASVFGSSSVAVRLNDGQGNFSGTGSVAVGAGPYSVAAADVDADGDLDLLTANRGSNGAGTTASVRLNDGRGNFSAGSEPAVGTAPSCILTADVDADGDLDLLTANYGTNTVSIRLNNGNGTFSGGSDPTVDTNTYTQAGSLSIATGDVDGDGDLDLLAANSGNSTGSTVSVRLNQPVPPLLLSFTPTSGGTGTSVALTGTDFTNTTAVTFNGVAAAFTLVSATQITAAVPPTATTGRIVVVAPAGTSTSLQDFMVSGAFTVTTLVPTRNQRNAPVATSVSFSFSQPISNTPRVLHVLSQRSGGHKSGAITATDNTLSFAAATPFKPGETITAVLTADLQSTSGRTLGAGQVFQFTTAAGAGSGVFPPLTIAASVGRNPLATAAADMNGDGHLDIVTLNVGASSLSIRFNNGSAQFSGATTVSVVGDSKAFAVVDVENDGDLDLVATSSGVLSVRLNNGAGTAFGSGPFTPIVPADTYGSFSLITGDVNADGYGDLLIPHPLTGAVLIFLNNRAGSFTNSGRIDVSDSQSPGCVFSDGKLADVDLDGDLDFVAVNQFPNSLLVRLNNGAGVFGGTFQMALAAGPAILNLADVNGDQVQDALVGFSNSVQTLLGTGTGTFTFSSSVAVGVFPRSMAVGDIDGDGDLDFVSTDSDSYSMSIRTNDGTGRFTGTATLATSQNPIGVALADLDGDSDLDVVMSHYTDSNIAVSLNPRGPVTSARASSLAAGIMVHPNPSTGSFTVDLPPSARASSLTLTLRTPLGQLVRTQQLRLPATGASITCDATGLAPGVYLLQGTLMGEHFTKRIVLY